MDFLFSDLLKDAFKFKREVDITDKVVESDFFEIPVKGASCTVTAGKVTLEIIGGNLFIFKNDGTLQMHLKKCHAQEAVAIITSNGSTGIGTLINKIGRDEMATNGLADEIKKLPVTLVAKLLEYFDAFFVDPASELPRYLNYHLTRIQANGRVDYSYNEQAKQKYNKQTKEYLSQHTAQQIFENVKSADMGSYFDGYSKQNQLVSAVNTIFNLPVGTEFAARTLFGFLKDYLNEYFNTKEPAGRKKLADFLGLVIPHLQKEQQADDLSKFFHACPSQAQQWALDALKKYQGELLQAK